MSWAIVLPAFRFRRCFEDLIEGMKGALELAGESVSVLDKFPPEVPGLNVVGFGGHVGAPARSPYPCWVYQTETFGAQEWFTDEYVDYLRTARGVIEFSPEQAGKYQSDERLSKVQPVVVRPGFVPALQRVTHRDEEDKDIPILFYGSISQRRLRVFEQIMDLGTTPSVHFGVFGAARDELIARSKVALNFRAQDDWPEENIRLFYLDTNGACVLNELDPRVPGSIGVGYQDLSKEALRLVADRDAREQLIQERAAANLPFDVQPLIEACRSQAA